MNDSETKPLYCIRLTEFICRNILYVLHESTLPLYPHYNTCVYFYLQRALLSGFLVIALHHFAVNTQTQHLTWDFVVLGQGMPLDFQLGIDGQGEPSGVGVWGLALWARRGALGRLCLLALRFKLWLGLGRVRVVRLRLSILEHLSMQAKLSF